MASKPLSEKILFGLKAKRLRVANNMSFAELSSRTGMSVSYLNEIEKGKKYPKLEKIEVLATAYGITAHDLEKGLLDNSLAPVKELLESNFLNELPLDLFGIELTKVVEIIANAPTKVGAFVASLVELSRSFAFREMHFYFNALRSYLELHNNYFPEIEEAVTAFAKTHNLSRTGQVKVDQLAGILEREYEYTIVENGLSKYPELKPLRALFVPSKKQLLLNEKLEDVQKGFQFGKELGFQVLNLEQRANTASLQRIESFEEVLNHFKAGYFSAALLLPREAFVEDLRAFFAQKTWNGEFLLNLLKKYQCSPETLFQRMTNVLPEFFDIQELFFMRFVHTPQDDYFKVDKEIHLDGKHPPHGNSLEEHYCRRWLSIGLANDLQEMQKKGLFSGVVVRAQRSSYFETDDEYLSFAMARGAYPAPQHNVSMTLGLKITDELKEKIAFLSDPTIANRIVNTTCERCPISDCSERVAPPTVVDARQRRKAFNQIVQKLEKRGVRS